MLDYITEGEGRREKGPALWRVGPIYWRIAGWRARGGAAAQREAKRARIGAEACEKMKGWSQSDDLRAKAVDGEVVILTFDTATVVIGLPASFAPVIQRMTYMPGSTNDNGKNENWCPGQLDEPNAIRERSNNNLGNNVVLA
jgi:hypothetical protein